MYKVDQFKIMSLEAMTYLNCQIYKKDQNCTKTTLMPVLHHQGLLDVIPAVVIAHHVDTMILFFIDLGVISFKEGEQHNTLTCSNNRSCTSNNSLV